MTLVKCQKENDDRLIGRNRVKFLQCVSSYKNIIKFLNNDPKFLLVISCICSFAFQPTYSTSESWVTIISQEFKEKDWTPFHHRVNVLPHFHSINLVQGSRHSRDSNRCFIGIQEKKNCTDMVKTGTLHK